MKDVIHRDIHTKENNSSQVLILLKSAYSSTKIVVIIKYQNYVIKNEIPPNI